jgi:CubicO group peptidase (beta-lactamase class C family)
VWTLLLQASIALAQAPDATAIETRVAAARAWCEALAPFGLRGALVAEHDGVEQLALGIGEVAAGGAPVTADTLFNLGSNSKCFTAAATLLLVDRGTFALDDRLGTLLPAVPPDKQPITIRELLTHSAGLDHSGAFRSDFEVVSRDDAIRRLLARPLLFAPGRDCSYSDAGYVLLAALIEMKSGVPFVDFMADELLEPLGLARTGFWGPDARLAALADADFASGRVDGDERGSGRQFAAPTFAILGAGGMVGSARDVAAFLRAVHDGELLSAESATAWESAQYRLGPQQAEGFGFVIATMGAKTVRLSAGGTPQLGHNALLRWSQPDDWLLVAHTADSRWLGETVVPKLAALLDGQAVALPPKVVAVDDAARARATGTFALEGGGRIELAAARGALALRPLDDAGFTALFGGGGTRGGTQAGIDRVLGQRVDPSLEQWRRARIAELGAERAFAVVGTTALDGGDEPWTFVRFDYERGSRLTRFIFGPRGSLEAIVLDAELPSLRLWPTSALDWVPFSLGAPPPVVAVRIAPGASAPSESVTLDFGGGRSVVGRRS